MNEIQKAVLQSDNDTMHLTLPINKIDEERRTVSGFASLDNIDSQGDRITSDANKNAFGAFRGNVRLMHQPIPAGKVTSFEERKYYDVDAKKEYTGVFVDTYVSKGAQDVWEMVLDGTLTGFSIGGAIKDYDIEYDEDTEKSVRVINEYDLVELSLVDSPANQLANIFSIEKTENGQVMHGMLSKTNVQNVFWCAHDRKAYTNAGEKMQCPFCRNDAVGIGWVETESTAEMQKSIQSLLRKHQTTEGGSNMSDTETVEKADEATEVVDEVVADETQEVVEKADDAGAEQIEFDFEKSFGEILDRVSAIAGRLDDIEKSLGEYTEKVKAQVSEVEETVQSAVKDFAEVTEKTAKIDKALKEHDAMFEKVAERVNQVEDDTALRKSGEVEFLPETTEKESLWGGRFLNAADIR